MALERCLTPDRAHILLVTVGAVLHEEFAATERSPDDGDRRGAGRVQAVRRPPMSTARQAKRLLCVALASATLAGPERRRHRQWADHRNRPKACAFTAGDDMAATDHDGHRGPAEFDWMTEVRCPVCGSPAFKCPGVLEDDKTGDLRRCGVLVLASAKSTGHLRISTRWFELLNSSPAEQLTAGIGYGLREVHRNLRILPGPLRPHQDKRSTQSRSEDTRIPNPFGFSCGLCCVHCTTPERGEWFPGPLGKPNSPGRSRCCRPPGRLRTRA
jgi:hypothetical protein